VPDFPIKSFENAIQLNYLGTTVFIKIKLMKQLREEKILLLLALIFRIFYLSVSHPDKTGKVLSVEHTIVGN
jgi:hypothetical protein